MFRPTASQLRLPLFLTLAGLVSAALPGESSATTWHIKADGTGDAPTIAAGLALAQANDVVLAAAGTYFEHDLQLKSGVTLASESGRDVTIIDAQGLGHVVIGADNAVLRGFTFTHSSGDAVYCYQNSPQVLENRFVENSGRCLLLFQSTSDVHDNELVTYPPATSEVLFLAQSAAHIHHNVVHGIIPNISTSAVEVTGVAPGGTGAVLFEDNAIYGRIFVSDLFTGPTTTFLHNVCVTQQEAFNIASAPAGVLIQENTLIGGIASLFIQHSSAVSVLRNIIGNAGTGIESFGSNTISSDCNDFYNVTTPYDGVVAGPNDFFTNPLFCDELGGDFRLQSGSPCAVGNSPDGCGGVGALGVGCAGTPARRTSWGAVKDRYRR